jgi:hypothetical protein
VVNGDMTRTASILLLVVWLGLPCAAGEPAPSFTPDQARVLALRAAQVDAYHRLADLVLAARLPDTKMVSAALGPASDAEAALRVFLRLARTIGDPRFYSDGVVEVDVEMPLDAVLRKVGELCGLPAGAAPALADLQSQAVDGYLRVEGSGRAPQDVQPDTVRKVEAARPDEWVEMFPAGWERVTAEGRVEAARRARIRAYEAMGERVRAVRLTPTRTVGELLGGSRASESLLDVFIRGLPVGGPPRFMPDRVAEVDVAAPVRGLIKVLKDARSLAPAGEPWADDEIDQLSVVLKTEQLAVTGRGMPPPAEVRPVEALPEAPGRPVPDWAAKVLEARGVAKRPDLEEVPDEAEARILAARAAKSRALSDLQRQLDAVRLEDGRTVHDRAAKDAVFRRDMLTFLAGAKTAGVQPLEEGKRWQVVVRLPLVRLWEFSRLPE